MARGADQGARIQAGSSGSRLTSSRSRATCSGEHPDWLVRRRDGSLQRIGNWENENSPAALAEVVEALLPRRHASRGGGVVARPVRDDRSAVGLRDDQDRLHGLVDPRGAELPRSDRLVRRGLSARASRSCEPGPASDCHILECGPGNTTVGLIDSMRVEADINYGYAAAAWKQYFQDPAMQRRGSREALLLASAAHG